MTKKTKGGKKPHASSTGGRGPRNVDMANWRRQVQESRLKFDDDAKEIFLRHYAENGRHMHAAAAAGVSYATTVHHMENDPEFMESFQQARASYKDRVLNHAQKLIFEGTEKPIIGGQFRDEIVAHETIWPVQLIAMEMKKVDSGYKDRQEIDLKNGAAVLVAPADKTPQQWIEEQRKKNEARDKPTTEG